MKQCKHCGSPYRQAKGRGEFCCAGCEHVYAMIRESGFGDYYARQDRAGRPVGDDPFSSLDFVLIKQLQKQAENSSGCKIILGVRGMSCLGCAWLVEQVARRQRGLLSARVALNSNRLSLAWRAGSFDLQALAEELHQFGYDISADAGTGGYGLSPLSLRLGLTLVFSFNGLFLLAASQAGLGGAGLEQLNNLLIIICLFFSQLVGGALFVRPAWRGLLLRRLHRDALPALILLLCFCFALASLLFQQAWTLSVLIYFLLLPSMVFARWLSERWVLKADV